MSDAAVLSSPAPRAVVRDYLELAKARIVFMVVLTTLAGYLVAADRVNPSILVHVLIGTALVAGGTNALNQFAERNLDGMMRRTSRRPLPAGRIQPRAALVFSIGVSVIGTLELAIAVNPLAAALAVFTLASYLFIYTPMKRVTSWSTLIGAVPGAVPPMIGWAAATGGLELGAWIVFGILFLWQLPHFAAIGWLYREDYARAGFVVLGVGDDEGTNSALQSIVYSLALLPVSLLPFFAGIAGRGYLLAAGLAGLAFLAAAVEFRIARDVRAARRLFAVSILYLPVLMTVLVLSAS